MRFLRNLISFFLCSLLILPMTVSAEEPTQAIARDLIAYYFHYRQEAAEEIDNQLQILTSLDPEEGKLWETLMERWRWINEEMPINTDGLPDGLPEDDTLCIVVLGYGLKNNGEMKPELLDRLETALLCAEKYPESYVLCTGGETAQVPGISEAGQMGAWLLENGLEEYRLILETESLSTTANAQNSLHLLNREYPQVSSIALVTSDYHIPWGYACFTAEALHREYPMTLVGNAACVTETPDRDTMYSQAWGISIIADIPFDSSYVPTLYLQEETEPAAAAVEAKTVLPETAPQPEKKEPVLPVLLGLAAVLVLVFVPKKRKSGST